MQLPALTTGLQWDTTQLFSEGILRVGATIPSLAVILSTHPGANLRFLTTAGVTYELESTPTLDPPINWTTVGTYRGDGGY